MLGVTMENLPAPAPYLSVPSSAQAAVLNDNNFRVGLVWRGNPKHENDLWRSVPLSTFNPLLDVEGVSFFSLQVGKGADEGSRGPWAERMTDLAPNLTNFADTAAAISALDLIITVDTAAAHLAGHCLRRFGFLFPKEMIGAGCMNARIVLGIPR